METRTILLHNTSTHEQAVLAELVAPLVAEVFPELEIETFVNSAFKSSAFFSRMYLYSVEGCPVGFHIFSRHRFEHRIIFRVFSCLGEKAKGYNSLERKGLVEIVRTRLRHPTEEIFFFTCYVNPIPYYVMMRAFYEAYPHFSTPIPEGPARLLAAIGDHFHFERVEGRPFFVRRTPASLKASPEEIKRINSSDKAAIKKFLEWCPDWLEGRGLITMAPISWRNVFWSLVRQVKKSLPP